MFLGVEDGSGVPGIVEIGISSVISLGVTGLVSLLIPVHGILGAVDSIPGAVDSVFPSIVSYGSDISVLNSLRLNW